MHVQVANFELTEEEAAALESEQAEATAAAEEAAAASQRSRAAGAKFWDSLLKAQHETVAAQELEQLGRGRRSRRAINYAEDVEQGRGGDAGAGTSRAAAAGGARKRGRDDEYQPEEEEEEEEDDVEMAEAGFDPMLLRPGEKAKEPAAQKRGGLEANGALYRGVPGDESFRVCGLDSRQRADFLQAVTRVGLPLGEDALMDFGAFCGYTPMLRPRDAWTHCMMRGGRVGGSEVGRVR